MRGTHPKKGAVTRNALLYTIIIKHEVLIVNTPLQKKSLLKYQIKLYNSSAAQSFPLRPHNSLPAHEKFIKKAKKFFN